MGEQFRSRGLTYADLTSDGLGHLNPDGHREAALVIRELLEDPTIERAPPPVSEAAPYNSRAPAATR
jgi:hypothetical protein